MATTVELPDPAQRDNYRWYLPLTTRWMDNDIYGHINNVIYYAYFDTIANAYLINECGLDIHNGNEIGYIVHSQCHYKSSLAYPDRLEGALRVNRIGNSSVEYGIALFKAESYTAAAHGTFTHVFVDRTSERPRPLSDTLRAGLTKILISEGL